MAFFLTEHKNMKNNTDVKSSKTIELWQKIVFLREPTVYSKKLVLALNVSLESYGSIQFTIF